MIDYNLRYGERLAFQVGKHSKPVLLVKSDGEKLIFSEKGGAISGIAGEGMERVIRAPLPDDERETYILKYVANGSRLRFSTPESHEKVGVYVDVHDEKFRIIGGASIIREIVGHGLASRIENDKPSED